MQLLVAFHILMHKHITIVSRRSIGINRSQIHSSLQVAHGMFPTASAVVSSPLQGKAIALEEVKDEVFSQKILGDGIAVVPEKGELYAPADGVIESVFGTKHAISMKTNAGAELLMHIGMDTVKRDGKGFDPQVKDGETVKKGQLLMKFDLDGIKADGYDVTTPIVVTNADEFTIKTVAEGAVVPGAALLKLEANK